MQIKQSDKKITGIETLIKKTMGDDNKVKSDFITQIILPLTRHKVYSDVNKVYWNTSKFNFKNLVNLPFRQLLLPLFI